MDYIQILGLAAAVLTTLANIPQAVKIIKTKSTKSISSFTYALLFTGLVLWTVYGLIRSDLPLILANGLSSILAGIILSMKLLSEKNKNDDFPV
jgi:MtN3 and saliva related transmembrane protein